MKAGSLDIMESTETKKAGRISKIKNVLILLLAVIVIVLAIKIGISSSGGGEDDGDNGSSRPLPPSNAKDRRNNRICTTPECISAAHRLLENVNTSADPCEDFNEFACGRFTREKRIPDDKGRITSFVPIGDTIYERARTILEEDNDQDWEVYKKAKKYYRSCIDMDKREELGLGPLTERLDRLIGGWPLLGKRGNDDGSDFSWYESTYKLSRAGLGNAWIVSVFVATDDGDTTKRAIFIDQPSLGLSREFLVKGFEAEYVQHYYTFMKESAVLLGAAEDVAEREMKEVLTFEIKLAEASKAKEERRNATLLYNPRTLGDIESLPGHPPSWKEYVSTIVEGEDISGSETVIVQNLDYLNKMSVVLKSTDPKTIANYFGWRMALTMMGALNKEAKEIRDKFNKNVNGIITPPPLWKTCSKRVGFNTYSDSTMLIVAGSMYVQKHFTPEAKKEMLDMIGYIKRAFERILDDITWMDERTKVKARKKLEKMRKFIAYPDELLDERLLDSHHRDIDIDEEDYIGNYFRVNLWQRRFSYSRLREKVAKDDWRDLSQVALVNAFYSSTRNAMIFPAGILQGGFFNSKVPRYLNYGAIGVVIGHEITHGFDDRGRLYGPDGNHQRPINIC